MDRESLALRNSRLAESLRRPTAKHRLRDRMLAMLARVPIRAAGAHSDRILVIRPDHLGDVLLSTPAIQAIKRSNPKLSIHALCGEWTAEVLANYPEIDRVLTIPFPGFRRSKQKAMSPWRLAVETARRLRAIGYGSAIVMRPDHWWGALVTYMAGIENRIGYDAANVSPFLTKAYPFEHRHAVEQNMRLVEGWTGEITRSNTHLCYPVKAADEDIVDQRLREWSLASQRRFICIHPGSGRMSKIWRADSWATVADELSHRYDSAIIYTGTAAESTLIANIVDKMKTDSAIIAGSTTVGQLAALYDRSLAVLGPDSGALHLAAAVDTPTVALFGPADPIEFAPWGDPDRHAVVTSGIGCRPCRILDWETDDPSYHPCVRDISAEFVLEAARRVLGGDVE